MLDVLILNLMPNKAETEAQLRRLLESAGLPVRLTLAYTATHRPRHVSADYLAAFYQTFPALWDRRFDGLILTGAPVEQMAFEEVDYWPELCEIMEWSKTHVSGTFHICWGAQAGLYYHYGVPKYPLPEKRFGVFPHRVEQPSPLTRGFDDVFYAPHSRHTEIRREDVARVPALQILASSEEAGLYALATRDGRQVFVTGHSEYDPDTLRREYLRDKAAGLPIRLPVNYFPDDDETRPPRVLWRAHANLLFRNWLALLQAL